MDELKAKTDVAKRLGQISKNVSGNSQGISAAVDARLEYGVDLSAELRLKMMVSMETDNVQSALNGALPAPPTGTGRGRTQYNRTRPLTDDELSAQNIVLRTAPTAQVCRRHFGIN